jgi:hypothetical protein
MAAACQSGRVRVRAPHPFLAIIRRRIQPGPPPALLCPGAGSLELQAVCLVGHLDRPYCLDAVGHVFPASLTNLSWRPSLRLAQTQLALFHLSWRGQVNFPTCVVPAPPNPVLNTSLSLLPRPCHHNTTTCSTPPPPPLTHKRTRLRHLHRHTLVRTRLNVRSARCYLLLA